ncbi:MAG TPA: MBL fold metallo-hydrolase [Syntrophorhabdaceae bacterium]|nr:MBL fold metallo-hydrolase [Syntrophorhabdaceae bacterium]
MIFSGKGYIENNLYVTGFAWSPAYLIDGDVPVIFESGFHCMARIYEADIRQVIENKMPQYLFITHVHYDHCGATSYLRKAFPSIRVAASQRAAEIIQRPNAQSLMSSLSKNAYGIISSMENVDKKMLLQDYFEPFSIDMTLKDMDRIYVCHGITVQVFETPGHTRDMLSYYIPEKKILIATESTGCRSQTGHIVTEFLVDFEKYITSLKRLSMLDIDVLCQGHHFVFTGDDVRRHLDESLKSAQRFRDNVISFLKEEGGSVDRVVEIVKAMEYDTNPGPKQPEKAYLLNLRTRVAHIAQSLSSVK